MNHQATRNPSEYDVIVVGARIAGAATAMLLARAGLGVIAFERTAEHTDTVSTHALMRAGVMQLSRWGVLDQIVAADTPAVRTSTYTYNGERVEIPIKPRYGVDSLYAPRRTVLDPVLVGAARAAGAEVHHGVRVTGLLWERGRVAGVRVRGAGGSREFRAGLVVGADGVRSIVANQVRAHFRHRASHWSAVSYGYWSGLSVDGYEFVFDPAGCSGAIPTNDGLTCVFASGAAHVIGRGGVGVIRSVVANGSPDLAEQLSLGVAPATTRTWPGTAGFVRAAHGPGWALVGDAGYFKDPIVAHGLTDALRDAELLARAVIAGSLADYEAQRDELSLPLFHLAERIASYAWDGGEIDGLLRGIATASAPEVELLAGLDVLEGATA